MHSPFLRLRPALRRNGLKWSPVRELHPPGWFCRPVPRLLGQRDKNLNQELENTVPERWPFDRIRRILPDATSRRFHATRPKPRLCKPTWLPFYTGGDSSLQSDLSAFIFRLPCGQQRGITSPCDSNRPLPSLRDNRRPDCAMRSGIKPLSASTADASLRYNLILSQASPVSLRHPTRRARPVVS